jgi:hypothetical protein
MVEAIRAARAEIAGTDVRQMFVEPQPEGAPAEPPANEKEPPVQETLFDGRYWARTSDPQLVELVLSQLS